MSQLSLMSQFGEIEDEDRDYYNRAFDNWQKHFSQYATLYRYRAGIKGWGQNEQQIAALYDAVSDDKTFKKLQKIDLGSESLNMTARNMVHGMRLSVLHDLEERQYKNSRKQSEKLVEQHESEKAAQESRHAELLQHLETREELLALEKEYETEQAAKRSVYYQRAQKFYDIKPVITRQANWKGTNEYDDRGERIGVHVYTYKLTFELINGEQNR